MRDVRLHGNISQYSASSFTFEGEAEGCQASGLLMKPERVTTHPTRQRRLPMPPVVQPAWSATSERTPRTAARQVVVFAHALLRESSPARLAIKEWNVP